MKTKNKKEGFTLIELLVVVAIVGIIAGISISFLGGARTQGNNAGVKTNLEGAKKQAELYYINAGGSYGTFSAATCPTSATAGSLFGDSVVIQAISKAGSSGSGTTRCVASGQNYAVAVSLRDTSYSWCIDAYGVSKQYNGVPTAAVNESTFRCN